MHGEVLYWRVKSIILRRRRGSAGERGQGGLVVRLPRRRRGRVRHAVHRRERQLAAARMVPAGAGAGAPALRRRRRAMRGRRRSRGGGGRVRRCRRGRPGLRGVRRQGVAGVFRRWCRRRGGVAGGRGLVGPRGGRRRRPVGVGWWRCGVRAVGGRWRRVPHVWLVCGRRRGRRVCCCYWRSCGGAGRRRRVGWGRCAVWRRVVGWRAGA